MLPQKQRLNRSQDYKYVLNNRIHCFQNNLLVVYVAYDFKNDSLYPRVGFIVSKAVGGAVIRNRVKRKLRHLIATTCTQLPANYLLVVRAKPAASKANKMQLENALKSVNNKLVRQIPNPNYLS